MDIKYLNLLKSTWEQDQGRRWGNRGDEQIQVKVHIYVEISRW
jgi:hypothetical protein